MSAVSWLNRKIYSISSQSYNGNTYGNFTIHQLEYIGNSLYIVMHDSSTYTTISRIDINASALTASTSTSTKWSSSSSTYYGHGLAYDGTNVWYTSYESNNAKLLNFSASTAYGSISPATFSSSGYGYGGVPLLSFYNGTKNSGSANTSLWRANPVTSAYSFSNFTGITLVNGTAPAGCTNTITFNGMSGGFSDITTDGTYFYTLTPSDTDQSAVHTYAATNLSVYVWDKSGNLVESTTLDALSTGQGPGGIAYDPNRNSLWIAVVNTGSTNLLAKLFEVPVGQPDPPTNVSPSGTSTAPATVKSLTPTVGWAFSDTDTNRTQGSFQVQVLNAGILMYSSGKINSSAVTFTVPASANLKPSTTYTWGVTTWDDRDVQGSYSSQQYFTTTSAPTVTNLTPGNPNSATPDGSSVNPRLSWTYADADNDVQTAYQVKITNASTGMLAYDSQKVTSATTYHDVPSGALGAGIKFYWNVTVWDNTGMSSTSASEYILTNNPPAALTLMSPVDTYRTTTRPVFVANIGDDVENDKQNFKIQIAEDSNFTVNLQEKITTTVTGWEVYNGTSWVAMPAGGVDSTYEGKQVRYTWQADLPEGKKYYWRMAPIDGTTGTAGAWSATRSVRIGNVLQFKLKAPVQTSVAAKKIVLTSNRKIPTDGPTPETFKVEVCNNGLDAAPTWEDATSAMLNGSTYSFVNTTKTGTAFAVDCRITINANDSLGPIECDGLGFSFS